MCPVQIGCKCLSPAAAFLGYGRDLICWLQNSHNECEKWSTCWHKHLAHTTADQVLPTEEQCWSWIGIHSEESCLVKNSKSPIRSWVATTAVSEGFALAIKEKALWEERTCLIRIQMSGKVSDSLSQFTKGGTRWCQQLVCSGVGTKENMCCFFRGHLTGRTDVSWPLTPLCHGLPNCWVSWGKFRKPYTIR